jgi:hypothetical protein
LLYQLVNNRRPNQKDWTRIFQPLKYTFSKSWHYRVILIIAGVASLIALVQMFYPIVLGSKNGIDWFMAMLYPLIVYFWIALRKGINEPWEPSLFVNLGLFGSITFGTELSRLFRNNIVWSGIEILFNSLSSRVAFAGAFAGAFTFVFALFSAAMAGVRIGIGALYVFFAVDGAGAVIAAVIAALVVALALAEAGAAALVGAVVGVVALALVAIAGTGAITIALAVVGYVVLICAGLGIKIWHSKKVDNKIIKLFAFLSFPLFCWFPLVTYFSTTALFRFLPWQHVALTWLVVIATCTALWFRGQQLDYQSRNPLQGLIPNPKEAQGISLKKNKKGLLYE